MAGEAPAVAYKDRRTKPDMLETGEPATPASEAPGPPAKTTFPNGRMTVKEAWIFCRDLCQAAKIEAPTLRSFKWYLQHNSEIESQLVPDPFGSGERVHSIAPEAVSNFVEKLKTQGVRAKEPERTEGSSPKETSTTSHEKTEPVVRHSAEKEFDARQALDYLHRRVGSGCELNQTTFGFYLAYDLIPSGFNKRQRVVRQGDLDAFVDLAPSGVYANHVAYETEMDKAHGDMTMTQAYAYYSDIDPNPIALNSFRSLVAAGIVRPIRTANDPKAPVLGFKKQEIDGFLAMRQRMLESTKDQPATKSFLTRKAAETASAEGRSAVAKVMEEVLERSKPQVEAALAAMEAEAEKEKVKATARTKPREKRREAPEVPDRRDLTKGPFEETSDRAPEKLPVETALRPKLEDHWVPISDGYAHYASVVEQPFTLSWFRGKVYKGELFVSRMEQDERASNPSGKSYLVDLRSIDAYAAALLGRLGDGTPLGEFGSPGSTRTTVTTSPKSKAWPVEKAYRKARGVIPPGLSLLQFKRLVRGKMIDSFVRGDVVYVRETAVADYFGGRSEVDRTKPMQVTVAYAYYCSRCTDPVAKGHFSRWMMDGTIAGGEKTAAGLWTLALEKIDAFLAEHPTGRLRSNRNSRVASDSRKEAGPRRSAPVRSAPPITANSPAPPQETASRGRITISIKNYPSAVEMQKALRLLTEQGFDVEVVP